MSRGYGRGNSHKDDDHKDGFDFSFKGHDFGWSDWGGHGNHNHGHGHHDHHHGRGFQIEVQDGQWVLTNGHVTHEITGNSVELHGETYLLVDQFGGG